MTEQEIVGLIKSGETRTAFDAIVKLYAERLYWQARRMVISHDDANDCLQDAMIRIWKSLPNFRGDSSLYTWVYRIVTNVCITFLNSRRSENLEYDAAAKIEAESDLNAKALQKSLHKAVATLPPKQKAVFLLRYFEEMPYSQMAEVLETSEGALKASYHHAYEKVKAYVEKDMDI